MFLEEIPNSKNKGLLVNWVSELLVAAILKFCDQKISTYKENKHSLETSARTESLPTTNSQDLF
jgi:hypothetical protein